MPVDAISLDRAVEWGKNTDMGIDPHKSFPFIYNFVPARDDRWPFRLDSEGERVADNLAGIGPAVAPGEIRTFQVVLDPDLNYLMQWVRLTVYYYRERIELSPIYEWYENTAETIDGQMDVNTITGTPLLRYLKIGIHIEPDSDYILGAPDVSSQVPARLSPVTIQGFDNGIGQITMPRLCPRNGMVVFTIENTHATKTLVVGGCIYGYKVRM